VRGKNERNYRRRLGREKGLTQKETLEGRGNKK
jgi:hypothetical protein